MKKGIIKNKNKISISPIVDIDSVFDKNLIPLNKLLEQTNKLISKLSNTITTLDSIKINASDVSFKGADKAQMLNSRALSVGAVAEGSSTASGVNSHAEGSSTSASGIGSHSEGGSTKAISVNAHAEGNNTTASGYYSHAEGSSTSASGSYSHAEGGDTTASSSGSHAEGYSTKATAYYSHAEGYYTNATKNYSHAEGNQTTADGTYSHAEGYHTATNGSNSHSEGSYTSALAYSSHAEGNYTAASGVASHAEGSSITESIKLKYVNSTCAEVDAANLSSVQLGMYIINGTNMAVVTKIDTASRNIYFDKTFSSSFTTQKTFTMYGGGCSGEAAHSEGFYCVAAGQGSHAEGKRTYVRNEGEHAEGKYNVHHDKTIHSVGIGKIAQRKNAHEIMDNGDHYVYGIGGYNGSEINDDTKTLQQIVNNAFISDGTHGASAVSYYLNGDYDGVNITAESIDDSIEEGEQGAVIKMMGDEAYYTLLVERNPVQDMEVATKNYVDAITDKKQDIIEDIDIIRANAEKGANAESDSSDPSIIVITEDMVDVETDATKGVTPYSTAYGYTNITIHDDAGIEWIEGRLYTFVINTKLIVTSANRNVRVRIGSGDWKPVFNEANAILSGASYFLKSTTRMFMYKTTHYDTGSLHMLGDSNTTYAYLVNTFYTGTMKIDSNGYGARYSLCFPTTPASTVDERWSSLVTMYASGSGKPIVTPSTGKFYADRHYQYISSANIAADTASANTTYQDYTGADLRYTANTTNSYCSALKRVFLYLHEFDESDYSFKADATIGNIVTLDKLSNRFPTTTQGDVYLYFLGYTTATWYTLNPAFSTYNRIYKYTPSTGNLITLEQARGNELASLKQKIDSIYEDYLTASSLL